MHFEYFGPHSRRLPRGTFAIGRRGYRVGWLRPPRRSTSGPVDDLPARWRAAQAIFLPGVGRTMLSAHRADLSSARRLYRHVLAKGDCTELLEASPYRERLRGFDLLASVNHENDPQEITTLEFDALHRGKLAAEDLWCKISWLSYLPDDASLRFRFSFGLVHYEDVAADFSRQRFAANLTDALFPESGMISRNTTLKRALSKCAGQSALAFVERIVYFNAPGGGAEFHQDVERGHLGVIYLQASGRTFWFALSKKELIEALREYSYCQGWDEHFRRNPSRGRALKRVIRQPNQCSKLLDDHERNEALLAFINQAPDWNRHLVERGHGYLLSPGDAIILPQHDINNCAWHSVFCPDKRAGEGLSFAFRSVPRD